MNENRSGNLQYRKASIWGYSKKTSQVVWRKCLKFFELTSINDKFIELLELITDNLWKKPEISTSLFEFASE